MFTSHSLDQILSKGAEYLQIQGAVYLADKPTGITSHDMIYHVRRSLKNSGLPKLKVGHAGTLDPLATGLLIILIGKPATRRQDEFMKQDKRYTTSMWLGIDSDTYDVDGELRYSLLLEPVLNLIGEETLADSARKRGPEDIGVSGSITSANGAVDLSTNHYRSWISPKRGETLGEGQLRGLKDETATSWLTANPRSDETDNLTNRLTEILPTFTGSITQTVPAYSAVKRGGKKLYELAREGIADQITLPRRQVEIFHLEITDIAQITVDPSDFKWAGEPPPPFTTTQIDLEIHCSSGTYIRSLVHDLGLALQTHAVVRHLRRTQIGEYTVTEAV